MLLQEGQEQEELLAQRSRDLEDCNQGCVFLSEATQRLLSELSAHNGYSPPPQWEDDILVGEERELQGMIACAEQSNSELQGRLHSLLYECAKAGGAQSNWECRKTSCSEAQECSRLLAHARERKRQERAGLEAWRLFTEHVESNAKEEQADIRAEIAEAREASSWARHRVEVVYDELHRLQELNGDFRVEALTTQQWASEMAQVHNTAGKEALSAWASVPPDCNKVDEQAASGSDQRLKNNLLFWEVGNEELHSASHALEDELSLGHRLHQELAAATEVWEEVERQMEQENVNLAQEVLGLDAQCREAQALLSQYGAKLDKLTQERATEAGQIQEAGALHAQVRAWKQEIEELRLENDRLTFSNKRVEVTNARLRAQLDGLQQQAGRSSVPSIRWT